MSTPKRIQLRRAKGWRKPEGAVVVSRPTRWGNPHPWRAAMTEDGCTAEYARQMAVEAFSDGLLMGDFDYPPPSEIRAELAGRDLACWCPLDQPCHADVLLEIANGGAA